ncbi:class I SAM-dependent methyltransferase [Bacillus sp. RG28]|uniref:Class I SAM-dependent methyltransferase n=1 Tax=Gottfriedia endophytica TaxID=2820819 RepID=A0A940NQ36_9BACI|nr:class I SAM-dependent methyltransferase [Gottfriedia endophytica]MBP0725685.1 class I SAM-dependent methyltransferase [Gottfriedia endophytica]
MKKVNYGIDALYIIKNLVFASIVIIFLSLIIYMQFSFGMFAIFLGISGIILLLKSVLMLYTSKISKLKQRKIVVSLGQLNGDEQILDIGCGRGLILIEAAKQLTSGKAIGLDIWESEDLTGNTKDAAEENAKIENVFNKVEFVEGDARQLPFLATSFDVVFSSMALHNIPTERERIKAIREIVRVLKPNGRFVIQDIKSTTLYYKVFQKAGVSEVHIEGPYFNMFPPVRIIVGRK